MITWDEHVAKWMNCQKCPLAKQRDRICLARGDAPCDVLFIGEAPGASEDGIGQPFKGPAGHLLDRIVERALEPWQVPGTVGADYNSVLCAYCNLVCCFPREAKATGENVPTDNEIRACEDRLIEFVNIAQPRLIVCVGTLANQWIDPEGIARVHIIHPAATMGPRMTQARKQQEILHAGVVLRTAVADMMQKPRAPWVGWTNGGHADTEKRLTVNHERLFDIPF